MATVLVAISAVFPASAAKTLKVGIEDERLVPGDPINAPQIVQDWKNIGIQVVRIHAGWTRIAPHQPSNPTDPNDPAYNFAAVDNAINLITAQGMEVYLTVTGPPEKWGRTDPKKTTRWKPNATKFAQFATAVAKRYHSKVKTYLIWNEPNVDQWIQPQGSCVSNAKCKVNAASIYRDIVRKSYSAIKAVDPSARIVIGELAPRGKADGSQTKPLNFLLAFACLDKTFKPITKGACKNFKPARGSSLGYHPHPVKKRPNEMNPDPFNAQMGDTDRLVTFLNKLVAKNRLKLSKTSSGNAKIDYTEFGYQTNKPDPVDGVSEQRQSIYLQESAYIAWKTPSIQSLVHYQWIDAPLTRSAAGNPYSEWQSGLFFNNQTKKLAYDTFSHPFWVEKPKRSKLTGLLGKTAEFWGQVRPGGAQVITLERKLPGAPAFERVLTRRTDSNGYWSTKIKVDQTANYRFTYTDSSGPQTSQEYTVKKTV